MIEIMKESMLREICQLDAECFNHSEKPRDIENIKALYDNNPQGCFVKIIDGNMIGYIFSRIMGTHGY